MNCQYAVMGGPDQSVYLVFRPLLAVCKVFGFSALQGDARGLRYSWCHPWLLYCFILQVAVSVMMHATLNLRRQSLPVTVFYDTRKWCFFVALLSTDRSRLSLLQGLQRFDDQLRALNGRDLEKYDPWKRGQYWHFLYHLLYSVGNNVVSYTLFYPKDKSLLAFVFDFLVKTFASQMVFSYTIIYIAFDHELCYRYRLLSLTWHHHTRSSANTTDRVRRLHANLTDIANQSAASFGRFFVVNLFFVFLEVLIYLYRTLQTNTNVFSNVQSVFFLCVNVASVPALSSSTHHLTKTSKAILEDVRVTRIAVLPRECGEKVAMFAQQLYRTPLTARACGFFHIDRQLIASMIVSMTTYLMVIIQMGPELGRLTASLFGLK